MQENYQKRSPSIKKSSKVLMVPREAIVPVTKASFNNQKQIDREKAIKRRLSDKKLPIQPKNFELTGMHGNVPESHVDFSAARLALEELQNQQREHELEEDSLLEQRLQYLKSKQNLNLQEMFELSRLSPESLEELAIENRVREVMAEPLQETLQIIDVNAAKQQAIQIKFDELEQKFIKYEYCLREMPNLTRQVGRIQNEFYTKNSEFVQVNESLQAVNKRITYQLEHSKHQYDALNDELKKMSDVVYKPSDVDDKIRNVYDMMSNCLRDELAKLLTRVLTSLEDQDNQATSTLYTVSRIDRMYDRMKGDVVRHETLCFELATKFDQQYQVMCKMSDSIESLKTYAILNDIHIEAYLPLQIATLSFEVGRGLIQKGKQDRYIKHMTSVLKKLEKNLITYCDPAQGIEDTKFRKLTYKVPSLMQDFLEQQNEVDKTSNKNTWNSILADINLGNIHLYGEQNPEIKRIKEDPRSAIAEYLIRRLYNLHLSTEKNPIFMTDAAKKISLQRKFESALPLNFKEVVTPLDLSAYHSFHRTNQSKIREMLDYSRVDQVTLVMNSEQATADEKIQAQYNEMKARKAKNMEEALEEEKGARKGEDTSMESVTSEEEEQEEEEVDMTVVKKRKGRAKVNLGKEQKKQDNMELLLYSKGKKNDGGNFGLQFAALQAAEDRNKQITILQQQTEKRINESEQKLLARIIKVEKNNAIDIQLKEEEDEVNLKRYISLLKKEVEKKFENCYMHFEKSNADIMESMAEQQKNLLEMMQEEESDIIEEEDTHNSQNESESKKFSSISETSFSDDSFDIKRKQSTLSNTSLKVPFENCSDKSLIELSVEKEKTPKQKKQTKVKNRRQDTFKKERNVDDLENAFIDPDAKVRKVPFPKRSLTSVAKAEENQFKQPDVFAPRTARKFKTDNPMQQLALDSSIKNRFGGVQRKGIVQQKIEKARENTNKLLSKLNTNIQSVLKEEQIRMKVNEGSVFSFEALSNAPLISKRRAPVKRRSSSVKNLLKDRKSSQLLHAPSHELPDQKPALNAFMQSRLSKNKRQDSDEFRSSKNSNIQRNRKKPERDDSFNSKDSKASALTYQGTRQNLGNKKNPLRKKSKKKPEYMSKAEQQIAESKKMMKKAGSISSFGVSAMSSLSASSYEDLDKFVKVEEIEQIRNENQEVREGFIRALEIMKDDNYRITEENIAMIKRFEQMDVDMSSQKEELIAISKQNFLDTMKAVENDVGFEVKRWKRMNATVEQKQDEINKCIAMFTEIAKCLSEEYYQLQYENRENIENITQYINMQIQKDFVDEKERENIEQANRLEQQTQEKFIKPKSDTKFRTSHNLLVENKTPLPRFTEGLDFSALMESSREDDLSYSAIMPTDRMASEGAKNYSTSLIFLPNGEKLVRSSVTIRQQQLLQTLWERLQVQSLQQLKVYTSMNEKISGQQKPIESRFIQNEVTKTFNKITKKHRQIDTMPIKTQFQGAHRMTQLQIAQKKRSTDGTSKQLDTQQAMTRLSPMFVHSNANSGVSSPVNREQTKAKVINSQKLTQNLKIHQDEKLIKSRNSNQTQREIIPKTTVEISSRKVNRSELPKALYKKSMTQVNSPSHRSPIRLQENSTPVLEADKQFVPVIQINNLNISTHLPKHRNVFTPQAVAESSGELSSTKRRVKINSKQIRFVDSGMNKYLEEADITKMSDQEIRKQVRDYTNVAKQKSK